MKFLSSLSLRIKVPAIVVGLSIITAIMIGVSADRQFSKTIVENLKENKQAMLVSENRLLEAWFSRIEFDVLSKAEDPTVGDAVEEFQFAWGQAGANVRTDLQDAYIHDNPHPTGEKHKLDMAEDNSFYSRVHAKYHAFFRSTMERYGYYDVFLFDANGDMVYSVYKELDFATSFVSGPYAGSGLGEAVRTAQQSAPGTLTFVDYRAYEPSAGAPAAFVAAPIYSSSNQLIGVYAIQMPIDRIQAALDSTQESAGFGTAYFVGSDGSLRSNVTGAIEAGVLDSIPLPDYITDALTSGEESSEIGIGLNGTDVLASTAALDVFGTRWLTAAETPLEKSLKPLYDMRQLFLWGGLVAVVVIAALGWVLSSIFTGPLNALRSNVQDLANRNYTSEIANIDRGDEFGGIASSVENLRESLSAAAKAEDLKLQKSREQEEVVDKLTRSLNALSNGELTRTLDEPFSADFEPLRENFNTSVKSLRELITEVINSCLRINSESDEISTGADELSRRTENQAATLEETAAALDELTSSVKQAAESAREVEETVVTAKEKALNGKSIVDDAVNTMKQIEASSAEISEILMVIEDIAFQTKLLALNAGVEASRAGDAGKGFAVVASEVGSLAKRSSDAAKEIKKIINGATKQVAKGVSDVSETGDAITAIAGQVSYISDLMADFASLANEQSGSLEEINIGVNHLDQVTQQNAAMAEQSSAASHALRDKAYSLSTIVGRFDVGSQIEQPKSPQSEPAPATPPKDSAPVVLSQKTADGTKVELFSDPAQDGVWQSY